MGSTTSRLALPYPVASDPNNVPSDMQKLAAAVDTDCAAYTQNTFANRPSPSVSGRLFLATDTSNIYYDTGSEWLQVNLNAAASVQALGDLLVATGNQALTRLAVGSNGQVLQASSGATNGVQWASVQGLPVGLTGATAATRYVGATTSGAPASGTFALGDFVIDQTGVVWICTGAGSPGTWSAAQSASQGLPVGLSGATASTRYAGGTTSGSPGSGTFHTGDFTIGEDGSLSVCTSGGSPGTWVNRPLVTPFGHLGATAGFQSVSTTGVIVTMPNTAQQTAGGVSVSSNGLVAPIAGRYRITHRVYATGLSNFQAFGDITVNSTSTSPPQSGAAVAFYKYDDLDYSAVGSVEKTLNAGDIVRAYRKDSVSGASTYGNTGYDGEWIEISWISP